MMRTLSIRYVALVSTLKHNELPLVTVTVSLKIRAISHFVVCPGFGSDLAPDLARRPGFAAIFGSK